MVDLRPHRCGGDRGEIWGHRRGGPPDRPALASGSGAWDAHEHARTHGIDCPEHWTRSQSDLADAFRHDGIDGAGDYAGNCSGAPGADAIYCGRGRIRESLLMPPLSWE